MLTGITGYNIEIFWPIVEPLIERCIPYADEPYTADEIHRKIKNREMQLWAVNNGVYGFGVTGIEDNICWIHIYSGEYIHKYIDEWKELIPWAKSHGCSKIRLKGRKGWRRLMKEFTYHKDYLEYII